MITLNALRKRINAVNNDRPYGEPFVLVYSDGYYYILCGLSVESTFLGSWLSRLLEGVPAYDWFFQTYYFWPDTHPSISLAEGNYLAIAIRFSSVMS